MQKYLKKLREIRDDYTRRKDSCSRSNDPELIASVSNFEFGIDVMNKCIDIFAEADKQVSSDVNFLISLCEGWRKDIPEGLTPMGYTTLTYEGDIAIKERFDIIDETYAEKEEPVPEEPKKRGIKSWRDKLGAIE